VYLLLSCCPCEGRISGIVDIPNAVATLAIPMAIFDRDVRPQDGDVLQVRQPSAEPSLLGSGKVGLGVSNPHPVVVRPRPPPPLAGVPAVSRVHAPAPPGVERNRLNRLGLRGLQALAKGVSIKKIGDVAKESQTTAPPAPVDPRLASA
jgi:hypothetical protein